MIATTEHTNGFIAGFDRLEQADGRSDHWFTPVRRDAITQFADLGFPSTRDEEWRYTNVAPIAKTEFSSARDGAAGVSPADITDKLFNDDGCSRIAFVNGRYCEALSSVRELPPGVKVGALGEAMDTDGDLVAQYLARYAAFDAEAFIALNTAFVEDGAFIHIPRNTDVTDPIHLVYVTTDGEQPAATHPRTLIVADVSSRVTVIESYLGVGEGTYLTNAVTEVVARDNAVVDHYKIGRESPNAYHIGTFHAQLSRDANVSSHALSLGGSLVRNNINTVLDGEGAECTLSGLCVLKDTQHVDNHLRVDHAKPHCDSREFFKGVLDDKSHSVFTGRIVVREDAQKTDGKQTNQNLLLSDEAMADSKPQLEIFADDVKCTHGATIGQVDDEAVFYLRSRGMCEASARDLLVFAFAREGIERIRVEPLRKWLEDWILARLPQGRSLGDVEWPSLT